MGLSLSPFKNIWNDVAGTVVGGVKDVGNLGSLAIGDLTGNPQEASNASAALNNSWNGSAASQLNNLPQDISNVGQNSETLLPTVGTIAGGALGAAVGGAADIASLGALAPVINPYTAGIVGAGIGSGAGQLGENLLQHKDWSKNVLPSAIGGAAAQGTGDLLGAGLKSVMPEVTSPVMKYGVGIAKNALIGGGSTTGAALAEGQTNPGQLGKDFLTGAATGGVIGAALPGLARGAVGVKSVIDNAPPLNDIGAIGSDVAGSGNTAEIPPAQGEPLNNDNFAKVFGGTPEEANTLLSKPEEPATLTPADIQTASDNAPEESLIDRGVIDGISHGNPANGQYFNQLPDPDFTPTANKFNGLIKIDKPQEQLNHVLLESKATPERLAYKATYASHLWSKLSPEDQTLADSLRENNIQDVAKQAKDPETFTKYANSAKEITDLGYEGQRKAGEINQPQFRRRFGAGLYTKAPDGQEVLENGTGGNYGHSLGRHYSTYQEIQDVSGRTRLNPDFHTDLMSDVGRYQSSITKNNLVNYLNQAFGADTAKLADGHGNLKAFDGVEVADKALAKKINSRAPYEYGGTLAHLFKGYDVLNGAMKNVKLSMGGFHNINEGLNLAALDPADIGNVAAATASKEAFFNQMNEWDQSGQLENATRAGLTIGGQAGNEFQVGAGDSIANKIQTGINHVPVFKQFHAALFDRQIPISKMATFAKYTENLDPNTPEGYAQMRGIARGLNNTYGGINRLVDGMSPESLKKASRAFLAVDYNEGQIRTLFNAISKGGLEGRLARQVVAGRMSILAMPGVAQAALTGQFNNKSDKQIAEFVGGQMLNPTLQTNWKTAGGIPKQIDIIPGIVNKVDRAITPMFNPDNPNKLSGVSSELTGNASPALSFLNSEVNNKDFYGNPMHGHGMSIAQDIGAAANSAAPIPFTPLGRALAGVSGLSNNPIVKVISGGQSGITPAEAALDISGAGRGVANPNAPEMKYLNDRSMVVSTYQSNGNPNQLTGLDLIHPTWNQNITKAQAAAIYANPTYEENKWNILAHDPQTFAVDKKVNDIAVKNGQPSNPLFGLSKKDAETLMTYEWLKHADPGSGANNTAAVMYTENKAMIDKYSQDANTYYNQMNALFKSTGGTKGSNEPFTVGGVPKYTVTQNTQNLVNQYYNMPAGTTREDFLNAHPEITQYFNTQFNAENVIRAQLNEPLLKAFPSAPSGLQNWLNQYMASTKAGRTALRVADPTSFTGMQNYLTQVDAWELAHNAGQAQFQGQTLNQSALKAAYGLGKYDIAKGTNAAGDTNYILDPAMAYSGGSGGGYTFSPSSGSSGNYGGTLMGTTPGGGKIYKTSSGKTYETGPTWAKSNSFYSKVGGTNAQGENYYGTVGGATDHARGVHPYVPLYMGKPKGLYDHKNPDQFLRGKYLEIKNPTQKYVKVNTQHVTKIKQGKMVKIKGLPTGVGAKV